jgi:hypothetical protein
MLLDLNTRKQPAESCSDVMKNDAIFISFKLPETIKHETR